MFAVRPMFVWALLGALALATPPSQAQTGAGLARYVPSKDLVFFVEFDGTNSHAAAWNRSAANRLLNDTKFGLLLEDLASQAVDAITKGAGGRGPTTAEVVDAIKRGMKSGAAFGAWRTAGRNDPSTVLVLRGASANGIRPLVERALGVGTPGVPTPRVLNKGGRRISTFVNPAFGSPAWWSEGEDLILTDEAYHDIVLAAIDGRAANVASHPARTAMLKPEDGFESFLRAFVDVTAIPMPPAQARAAGLNGLKRVEFRWGVQDNALLSVLKLVAPTPRSGLLSILDGATFEKTQLPTLPADLHGFTVLSLRPGELVEKIIAVSSAMDPAAGQAADRFFNDVRANIGFDMKKDVLGNLGPKMAWAMRSNQNEALDMFVIAQVKEPAALVKALDAMTPIVNAMLGGGRNGRPAGPVPQMKKVAAATWNVELPPGLLPPLPYLAGLKPTIRVGRSWLMITPRPELMSKLAATVEGGGKGWAPKGDYTAVMNRVPSNLVMLDVQDPRDSFPQFVTSLPAVLAAANGLLAAQGQRGGLPIRIKPELLPTAAALSKPLFPSTISVVSNGEGISVVSRESIPSLSSPASAGIVVGLMLPAVQAAREAARRAQCVNNLKQIGLAMHNHMAVTDAFPKQAITDKNGKPLLSWRVAILPYIEQQALYNRFHLDEPWDSPHNKALIPLMPMTYGCPSNPSTVPGMTHYMGFAGPGTLLEPNHAVKINEITDGTSLTLLVVEAEREVEWTKPEDLNFDPAAAPSLLGAASKHPMGLNVLLADGSVRFLKSSIDPTLFKQMITRNGGEPIRLP